MLIAGERQPLPHGQPPGQSLHLRKQSAQRLVVGGAHLLEPACVFDAAGRLQRNAVGRQICDDAGDGEFLSGGG